MISFKDYAKQNGISYEAVRAQVKRFATELEGHIVRDGRQQLLDDEAVAFLDSRRASNPVVIYQQGKDEQIEELKAENLRLLRKQEMLRDRLDELNQLRIEQEGAKLLLAAAQEQMSARERAVTLREASFDQELAEARQEAARAARADAEAEAAQEAAKAAQKAQDELTAAQERERLLKEYAAALDAWSALGWLKRKRTPKPAMPELPEED